MPDTVATGRRGEIVARAFLKALGYDIRSLNVRLGRDEIDIIAYDPADDVLVFAEVKARSSADADYRPDLNLTARKKSCMSRAARKWIAKENYEGGYRLDLLCVARGSVTEHWKEVEWD